MVNKWIQQRENVKKMELKQEIKYDDNIKVNNINTITNPNTKTLIDRYVFASNFCKEKKVLDVPSGYGYGSMILKALGAKSIDCFDIDTEALSYIKGNYSDVKSFNKNMVKEWDNSLNDKYDCVVSIEGFEHVKKENVNQMLINFKNTCVNGGTIIITTPKRKTEEWVYRGGTHFYEYDVFEFKKILNKFFNNVQLYFALEFRINEISEELNTIFSKDILNYKKSNVMVAIIRNEK